MKSSPSTGSSSSVWAGSQLPQRAAPLKKGVRPWESLSDSEKKKFAAAFTSDSAFRERRELLLNGENLYLSLMLAVFQTGVEQEENGIPSTLEMEVREQLLAFILYEMIQGRWSSLQRLAAYGKQHAKKGLRKGRFPAVADLIESAEDILAVRILRTFADLSGVRVEDLLLPPIEDPKAPPRLRLFGKAILLNPSFSPRGLPTKRTLKRVLRETDDSEVPGFSVQLKRVGLAGLPKSGKGE